MTPLLKFCQQTLSRAFCAAPGGRHDVTALLFRSSQRLGRPLTPSAAEELSSVLASNWFDKPDTLLNLSVEDAMQMGLPSRLIRDMQDCLRSGTTLEPLLPTAASADALTASAPAAATANLTDCGLVATNISDNDEAIVGNVNVRATPRYMHHESARPSGGTAKSVRLTQRRQLPTYRLLPSHSTPAIEAELAAFERFLTTRFLGQQEARVAPVTARKYVELARGALGWLHKHPHGNSNSNSSGDAVPQLLPLEKLSLRSLIPGPAREDVATAFAHIVWLEQERGVSPATEATALRALIAVAKFVLHDGSCSDVARGDKPYHDVPLIAELRRLANDAKARWRVAPAVADEGAKWMGWPAYLAAVEALREEARAGRDAHGRLRSRKAIAWSCQQYLIFSILACIPDRQRTLRELQLERTLVREPAAAGGGEENFWIKHTAADYKTGKDYGDRPPMMISPALSPILAAWADEWRAELEPRHDFFFTQKNGAPFSATSLGQMFSNSAYRLTGRKTNPHMVRDMIVTHLRSSDASERELEALAIFMGHSLATQKDSYDRRSKAEKVAPAVSLLESTNAAALMLNAAGQAHSPASY